MPEAADLTVVTPAIPTRLGFLQQNIISVRDQTVPVHRHVIGIDYARAGIVAQVNQLAAEVETEWMVILADDDLLLQPFTEQMMAHTKGAQVVYSRPVSVGANWQPYRYEFSAEALRKYNFIPATALIRTDLWRRLGGYRHVFPEDWDFWLRALDARAHFRHVPEHNWVYRFHQGAIAGGNRLAEAREAAADPGASGGDAEPEHRGDGVPGEHRLEAV